MTIRSLQHFAFTVPEPDEGRRFYEDFGLEARADGDAVVLRCRGRDQDQVVLVPGAPKRLRHLSFGARADELTALAARLEANGVRLLDSPAVRGGADLWFQDPDGFLLNVCVAATAPWASAPEWRINSPGHVVRVAARGCPPRATEVRPRRLGHVLLFTSDLERQLAFYVNVLGFRLSDRCQDVGFFLRTWGDSDHHVLAFFASHAPGFHHASFEVGSLDEIGVGARRMLERGYRDGWGLGRHVIGSNFFHYIRDPWNTMAEYFCDIDFIPEDAEWEARNWPEEDSLYLWGPRTPAEFAHNFDAPDRAAS